MHQMGRAFQRSLLSTNSYHCGHATIKDVATGELDDSMASFFLSETLKYLYLLTSNTTSFIDAFVFSTEAHIFPPLPSEQFHETEPRQLAPAECRSICVDHTEEQLVRSLKALSSANQRRSPSAGKRAEESACQVSIAEGNEERSHSPPVATVYGMYPSRPETDGRSWIQYYRRSMAHEIHQLGHPSTQ